MPASGPRGRRSTAYAGAVFCRPPPPAPVPLPPAFLRGLGFSFCRGFRGGWGRPRHPFRSASAALRLLRPPARLRRPGAGPEVLPARVPARFRRQGAEFAGPAARPAARALIAAPGPRLAPSHPRAGARKIGSPRTPLRHARGRMHPLSHPRSRANKMHPPGPPRFRKTKMHPPGPPRFVISY